MTDNVIKFPTKYKGNKFPKIVNVNPNQAQEDLDFADNLAEGLMIGLIHNIGENGIDIKNERFIGDVSFLNEVVRGILYRDIGFKHPMQPFMDTVVKTVAEEEKNTITTKKLLFSFNSLSCRGTSCCYTVKSYDYHAHVHA